MVIRTTLAAMYACVVMASVVAAQVAPGEEVALRATQQDQFEAMFEDPDNVDLMFQYALTSIRLEDFEAAITTLERILIYSPNLPSVKVELGASYFRIGSYPVAKFYFDEVRNDDNAGPVLKERVQTYIDEIERRTRRSYFTGKVGMDAVFTTNANFGPEDRNALLLGTPVVLTGAKVTSQSDFGVGLVGQVSHVYDLGLASGDTWRSDVAFSMVRFAETAVGATDVAVMRTGPRLSLDDDRYGPKLRPYAELSHVRFSNDPLQSTIGAGFELTNTLNANMALFSDLRIAWVDNHVPTALVDQDGLSVRANVGLNYFANESLTLRGYALAEYAGAETASEESCEFGIGGRATYRYDSGLDAATRDWQVIGGARTVYRQFKDPGIFDPTRDRNDFDVWFHLGHKAFLADNFSVEARVEYFFRDSNIQNFDLDNFTAKVGIRFSF